MEDQEDNKIKEKIEEQEAVAAVAAKVILAVLVVIRELLVVEATAVMELLVIYLKLVKVEVEDQERDRPLVLMVEKVVVKEKLQMLVVIPNTLVVLVEPKVLQYVKQVE